MKLKKSEEERIMITEIKEKYPNDIIRLTKWQNYFRDVYDLDIVVQPVPTFSMKNRKAYIWNVYAESDGCEIKNYLSWEDMPKPLWEGSYVNALREAILQTWNTLPHNNLDKIELIKQIKNRIENN